MRRRTSVWILAGAFFRYSLARLNVAAASLLRASSSRKYFTASSGLNFTRPVSHQLRPRPVQITAATSAFFPSSQSAIFILCTSGLTEGHSRGNHKELQRRRPALPQFELQHRIRNRENRIVARADFAFVPQRLAVFCDGAHCHLVAHQRKRDLLQRRELVTLDWKALAFTGSEISSNVGRCVDEIAKALQGPRAD